MTTKHTIELTCDACGLKSDNAYNWARIDIKWMPDQHFDACPDCWKRMRKVIYPPRQPESNGMDMTEQTNGDGK